MPVATTMLSSGTCSAMRLIRAMSRPWPTTVTSTIVSMPCLGSSLSLRTALATRWSSSPHSSGLVLLDVGRHHEHVLVHQHAAERAGLDRAESSLDCCHTSMVLGRLERVSIVA